ncbi:centrosomal protein of 55 kDa [Rhincodon typus]|uniref:centrosomal protein of 55 kDa n=1 Tax=Rhincodon typus TaxID=259920 RepID=UPI00202F560E|nr:centrosomal protein of 55 kDa [Rhincodon typus]
MTSKNIISSRFGLRRADVSRSESDTDTVRKENALLKKSLEELSKGQTWERERNRLLEALEKNQQWLIYDQQREAYVRGLLGRIFELEQQNSRCSDSKEETNQQLENKQKYYEQLLSSTRRDCEAQRDIAERLKLELSDVKKHYEEKNLEVNALNVRLQAEQGCSKWKADEEKKCSAEKIQKLQTELENLKAQYEEEKKRSADLLYQIQLLQRSSINQQEEQTRNRMMEQQMQNLTLDFESEKQDRQKLQHQLQKVLKELHKAREQITRLENTQVQDICLSDPVLYRNGDDEDKLPLPKSNNLLDESFLACPKCKAQYPTSQHRDLLDHVDYCNY